LYKSIIFIFFLKYVLTCEILIYILCIYLYSIYINEGVRR
jgi:hypothetical protein